MANLLSVSLIIPVGEDDYRLRELLFALASGQAWPQEILIVNASSESIDFERDFQVLMDELPPAFASGIRLLSHDRQLFPGAARNLGITQSSFDWLAFLDVNTIPTETWLLSVFDNADFKIRPVVFGVTRYLHSSWKQLLFIQATYGQKPLRTLPGTLIHRELLNRVGFFLPGVRAGEDTDWFVRFHQFNFKISPVQVPALTYRAVPNTMSELIAKWFRNYRSCAPVVFHLETQKTIYLVLTNALVLYVAFRWNAFAAGWEESSFFYIDDITKLSLLVLVFIYFLFRGLLMPMRRGSSLVELIPFRWLAIGLICFIIDVTKLLAFTLPPWRNRTIV